jgi:diadenosine tetraphosphate (Ap4A) HIT family hydrolase
MNEPTVFDKIVDGSLPSYKIWEDDGYMAFLSRWPNTPGFTVVVPKINPGANYTSVDDAAYTGLLLAARKVAALLQKAFGVNRVGLVIEGEGVPHLHVKLIPMHGIKEGAGPIKHEPFFTDTYQGYLVTGDGPEMSDDQLKEIQAKIVEAAK